MPLNAVQAAASASLKVLSNAVSHDISILRVHKYSFFDFGILRIFCCNQKTLSVILIVSTKVFVESSLICRGGKRTLSGLTGGWLLTCLPWNHVLVEVSIVIS
jgi:hypothetical protein